MTASVVWRWRTELVPGASSARCEERTRFSASSNQRPLLFRQGRFTSSIVRRSPGTERPRMGGLLRLNSSRAAISDASMLSRMNTCSGTSQSSGHSPMKTPSRRSTVSAPRLPHWTNHYTARTSLRENVLSVVLAHDVDERGPAFLQDDVGGPPDRSLYLLGILDRAFPVPAHCTRDGAEVGSRLVDLHADVGARDVGAARVRHPLLMLPVVVVGPVVAHHREHRGAVVRRDPERAEVEHEIAGGLEVDDEAPGPLVCEGNADRHADLGRSAEARARVPVLTVEVPDLRRPAACGAGRQHPVVILDRLPHLGREARGRNG